jgi:lipopolysaccharide transport system ATP-binding protein
MMNDTVIRVEDLGKRYRIGAAQAQHDTLRDMLMAGLRAPLKWLRRGGHSSNGASRDTFWALKDVDLHIRQGEAVGLIGRNGAGKSTLLKILSRITKPTEGRAVIKGRVGSLLEVGTGFHPELTGRENIYLNGAILGMHRAEIARKFDEIVAFAEIDRFLDTPVKRYSSGMYVRLAFAVAAHLEPEILLVDEVLAVGDAAFQEKCLGKMGDVAHEGRTVLFVSHNMLAVQSLCNRAIRLHGGKLVDDGPPAHVVTNYLEGVHSISRTEQVWDDVATAPGTDQVRLRRVCVRPIDGSSSDHIALETPVVMDVEFWNLVPDAKLNITLHIYTEEHVVAFTTGSVETDREWGGRPLPAGLFRSVCQIPGRFLNSGVHRVLLLVVQNSDTIIYQLEDALAFEVLDLDTRVGSWWGKEPGAVRPLMQWTTEYLGDDQRGESR